MNNPTLKMNNYDQLIMDWYNAKVALAQAKEAESILREQVIRQVFQPLPMTEGTQTIELGRGYKLKAQFVVNRKFTIDSDALIEFLSKFETFSDEAAQISENIVRWKGELSMSTYRELPTHYRHMFDAIIVASDGMPQLDLITPKQD
jgi:hypothetical protein